MNELLELSEWDSGTIRVDEPTLEDLELVGRLSEEADGKLELRWLRDGRLEAKSTSWVGVVRLSTLTIQVRPKFAGYELGVIRMMEYAGDFRSLRRVAPTRRLSTEGVDLLDLLCLLLAEECELIYRDGLIHDYAQEEDSLPALRGSLRYREQATRRFGQLDILECRFDEFHADVLDNKLLATGLAAAARVCQDRAIRRSLRRLSTLIADLSSLGPPDAQYYRERLTYGRRNERYRRGHELSLLLLDRLGVEDLFAQRQTDSFAFLIDMNEVFEAFVTAAVTEAFRGTEWAAVGQRRVGSVITNRQTGKRYSSIIPDIVLTDGVEHVPFDCKYKLYGTSKQVSTADIYQTFFYAYALADPHSADARAGIIYPNTSTSLHPLLAISRIEGPMTASLTGIGVDLLGMVERLDAPDGWSEVLAELRSGMGEVLAPPALVTASTDIP